MPPSVLHITGIELLCYNEPIPPHRAYAFTTYATEDPDAATSGLLECKSLFSGRNITTEFDDMWCTSLENNKFCHIVIELREPSEITSE